MGVYTEENDESNENYSLMLPYNSYEGAGNGDYYSYALIFQDNDEYYYLKVEDFEYLSLKMMTLISCRILLEWIILLMLIIISMVML